MNTMQYGSISIKIKKPSTLWVIENHNGKWILWTISKRAWITRNKLTRHTKKDWKTHYNLGFRCIKIEIKTKVKITKKGKENEN